MSKNILFAPHNDDESLYAAFTILREQPLVVVCFDSYIQPWTDWQERRLESTNAMSILGVDIEFLALSDKDDTIKDLEEAMSYYKPDKVWAATGSHKHHRWVGEVARKLWSDCTLYSTYDGDDLHVETDWQVMPNSEELLLKELALNCYKSQLEKNKVHFDAVKNRSEYYVS